MFSRDDDFKTCTCFYRSRIDNKNREICFKLTKWAANKVKNSWIILYAAPFGRFIALLRYQFPPHLHSSANISSLLSSLWLLWSRVYSLVERWEQRDERRTVKLRTYNLCCRLGSSLSSFIFRWNRNKHKFAPLPRLHIQSKLMANLRNLFPLHSPSYQMGVKDLLRICERYLDFVWSVFPYFFISFHLWHSHCVDFIGKHASRPASADDENMMRTQKQLLETVWCHIHELFLSHLLALLVICLQSDLKSYCDDDEGS